MEAATNGPPTNQSVAKTPHPTRRLEMPSGPITEVTRWSTDALGKGDHSTQRQHWTPAHQRRRDDGDRQREGFSHVVLSHTILLE